MAETTAERPAVSGDDLQKLVALLKNVDTVELKLTVPEPDQLSTVRALELDSLQAQLRQVFFFETPDLALDKAGVVVRARRSQKKGDDTVVKLRPESTFCCRTTSTPVTTMRMMATAAALL